MCPPVCPVPGPPHCPSACKRGPPSLSALTWVVESPPGWCLPSPHPAPPQHPSRLHQEVAALGFGWKWPPRRPPLQWGPVGPGPRGRHHSAPERHPGLVSLLHQRSPNVRDPGCGLDKGVSRGAFALGPHHQELIGRATAAPVTPLAYTSGCWGLLGLHLHQSHFPISFC